MTTYNISDLKTPEMFLEARFGHIEDLASKIRETLGRSDMLIAPDVDSNYTLDSIDHAPDTLVEDVPVSIHFSLHGDEEDDDQAISSRGAWSATLSMPHVDNEDGDWTNSFLLLVVLADGDFCEELQIENGNPHMMEIVKDRINYWFPKA